MTDFNKLCENFQEELYNVEKNSTFIKKNHINYKPTPHILCNINIISDVCSKSQILLETLFSVGSVA